VQSEEDDDVTLVENTFVEDDEYDYQASSVLGSTREGEERFGTKDDGDDDDDKQKSLRQRAFIFIFIFFFFFFFVVVPRGLENERGRGGGGRRRGGRGKSDENDEKSVCAEKRRCGDERILDCGK
jgi:hypothetical protein|tara:strand:- start:3684 stop:4058 length:375 start_codon:yes stop_codon:yes gene_type:complete